MRLTLNKIAEDLGVSLNTIKVLSRNKCNVKGIHKVFSDNLKQYQLKRTDTFRPSKDYLYDKVKVNMELQDTLWTQFMVAVGKLDKRWK